MIDINDQLPDPSTSAVDWLETNGYDVTAIGPEVIRPYLEDGMFLLAFKLTKQAQTGDIRPVVLTYDAEVPMIPIKLTAVAANQDMVVDNTTQIQEALNTVNSRVPGPEIADPDSIEPDMGDGLPLNEHDRMEVGGGGCATGFGGLTPALLLALGLILGLRRRV